MRRITFLICLFGFLTVQAQETKSGTENGTAGKNEDTEHVQSKIITIDPFGSDYFIQHVRFGDRVKFKILNVNTFKINGLVVSKSVNIDFAVPAIISDLVKQADSITLPVDKSVKSKKETTFEMAIVAPNVSLTKEEILQNAFIVCFRAFLAAYQRINGYTSLEDNLNRQLMDSVFIRNIEALKANCTSEYLVSYDVAKDFIKDKKRITEDLSKIDSTFTSLKLKYEELQNMQKDASFTMSGTLQSTDKKNSLSVKNAEVRLETKKYFEDEYSFAKKVHDQLSDATNRKALIEKAYAGIDLYNKIQKDNFTIYTDSEPANADEVTLTPTLKFANGKVAKEFNPYQIKTTGGVKVNFSSGYLLSFIGDDNYTLYRDPDGKILGASKGNSNKITHALGALAHVYCRTDKDYNFALSTGISLANNSSLGFYFGGSLLFTEKNRLVISSGISYIQVQKLNTANLEAGTGDKNTFISASDNTIKYDQVYRPSLFVSITYNLSGNK